MTPPKRFDISSLTGGCSEGLAAFRIFFKNKNNIAGTLNRVVIILGLCIDTDIRRYIDRYDIIYLSAEGFLDTSVYIGGDI